MATPQQHYVVRIEEVVRYYYHVEAATPEAASAQASEVHLKVPEAYFDVAVESRQVSVNEVGA